MNDLKWIFLFVLEKQMSLPTLRFRIDVQQNPYVFFGIDFHVINEKKILLTRLFGTSEYYFEEKIRNNVHFNFCLQLYNIVSAYLTHNIMVNHSHNYYLLNAIITAQCH